MSPPSKKMQLNLDISRILRVPGGEEEPEEFYDHPFHSTAVYVEGIDHLEKEELPQCNMSPNSLPNALSQGRETGKSKHLQNSDTSESKASKCPTESLQELTVKETRHTLRKTKINRENSSSSSSSSLKTRSSIPRSNEKSMHSGSGDDGPSEGSGKPVQSSQDDPNQDSENLSETPADTGASEIEDGHQVRKSPLSAKKDLHQEEEAESSIPRSNVKSKGKKRKKSTHNKRVDSPDVAGPSRTTILCPKEIQRSPKDLTELDVVLDTFEKTITNYKETVESNSVREGIDLFFSSLKKKLIRTSEEVHRLKNLKKKNAKLLTEINKKRRRLVEVKEELIETESKQKQLQREYDTLEENMSSLRNAKQYLHDLQELKRDYLDYRKHNSEEKETYGVSSLPALVLESRTILGAEKHFHNINTKLQHLVDMEKEAENMIQNI
ncbi:centromere protein U isoform X2 [Rhinatrema bivittatum]|uniref:centromere protein U isoform X2 n=1 Tax=Rhinatrema bivittatum TaxID=194408 RepID=UPI00112AF220|nr:centromere protein U isoform X2 [Rhinatrema bivittatum]